MFSRTANLNQYRPGTPTVPLAHVWRTALLLTAMLLLSNWSWSATTISATRVWPAQDYTRITLESAAPLQFQLLALKNPDRLALDIDGINVNAALEELSNKIGGNDPYVKSVRVGRFKQGTVRLVFDLKADVKPEVFTLRPVAEYGHRLVLDIYPAQSTDPLITLLEKNQAAPATFAAAGATGAPTTASANKAIEAPPAPDAARPPTPSNPPNAASSATPKPARAERTLIVAIDAGHGGEDPGAKGRRGTYEKDVTLAIAGSNQQTLRQGQTQVAKDCGRRQGSLNDLADGAAHSSGDDHVDSSGGVSEGRGRDVVAQGGENRLGDLRRAARPCSCNQPSQRF